MRNLVLATLLALIALVLSTSAVLSRPPAAVGDTIIAFESSRDGNSEIYVIDPDARAKPTRFTKSSTGERQVALSPDGRSIAFASKAAGSYDIYVQSLAPGAKPRRITKSTAADLHPTWSPDSATIAFQSNRSGVKYYVYTVRADGRSKPVRLTKSKSSETEPDWSTKNLIAFTQINGRNYDIAYSDTRGRITSVVKTSDREEQPAWSPDGTSIAYTRLNKRNRDIWTVTAASARGNPNFAKSSPKRLTTSKENDVAATWSPDGNSIAWTATRSRNQDIWVMSATGTAARRITSNRSVDSAPSWRKGKVPASVTAKPTPAPKPTATPTPRPTATPRPPATPTPKPSGILEPGVGGVDLQQTQSTGGTFVLDGGASLDTEQVSSGGRFELTGGASPNDKQTTTRPSK